jgi:Domain of unknown function (DUF4262)
VIETIDPFLLKVATAIEGGVWHTTHVEACDAGPAITYTTGLWKLHGVPEVVVCAMEEATAYALLDQIGRAFKDGFRPTLGARCSQFLEDADVVFIRVDEAVYEEALEHAVWYYAHHLKPPQRFPVLQCVLPHKGTGRFPWEDGYPRALDDTQPLLGEAPRNPIPGARIVATPNSL